MSPAARRGLTEPRHLRQAPRDDRCLGVVAQPRARQRRRRRGRSRSSPRRRARPRRHPSLTYTAEPRRDQLVLQLDRELLVLEAITAAAGRPAAISSAWFGPERTATGRPRPARKPSAAVRIESLRQDRTGRVPGRPARPRAKARLGTARQTSSASAIGASATVVATTAERSASGTVARVSSRLGDRERLHRRRGRRV